MTSHRFQMLTAIQVLAITLLSSFATSQAPSPALLVLEKEDKSLAIVDPGSLKVVTRVSAGEDPHEVVVSEDGRRAYISNYGGFRIPQNTLSVVDLASQQPMPAVDLGALRAPHGLEIVNDKIYFTAEGSKVIGCYDPAAKKLEWVVGTGQDRTHMLKVKSDRTTIFTANMTSNTISFFEQNTRC